MTALGRLRFTASRGGHSALSTSIGRGGCSGKNPCASCRAFSDGLDRHLRGGGCGTGISSAVGGGGFPPDGRGVLPDDLVNHPTHASSVHQRRPAVLHSANDRGSLQPRASV